MPRVQEPAGHAASHPAEPNEADDGHTCIMAQDGLDPLALPRHLPIPQDDGAAGHLSGAMMPGITLPATDGSSFPVDRPPAGFDRLVLYAYPSMGPPGDPPL